MYIKESVDKGKINRFNDVKFVQEFLTCLAMQDMRLDTIYISYLPRDFLAKKPKYKA